MVSNIFVIFCRRETDMYQKNLISFFGNVDDNDDDDDEGNDIYSIQVLG